jgi:hypothetical protein
MRHAYCLARMKRSEMREMLAAATPGVSRASAKKFQA